ncbi:MAG: hypothetical protein ACREF3_03135 [Acetobacteraceae bacterium]
MSGPPPIIAKIAATAPAPTASFVAKTISLQSEADQVSVDDRIKLQDADLRVRVAWWIIWTFVGANVATLIALGCLAWLDQINIRSGLIHAADRIITNQVFMTLLGATTVQVGAIMVIIARYLFPGRVGE